MGSFSDLAEQIFLDLALFVGLLSIRAALPFYRLTVNYFFFSLRGKVIPFRLFPGPGLN